MVFFFWMPDIVIFGMTSSCGNFRMPSIGVDCLRVPDIVILRMPRPKNKPRTRGRCFRVPIQIPGWFRMPVELFVRLGVDGIVDLQVRVDPICGGQDGEFGNGIKVSEEFG